MTYDARYMPPFRINARVRLNPDWAALYPPRVRAQDSGTVGAHGRGDDERRSNVHFPDGSEYEIRDEHLLDANGEPPAGTQPTVPAPTVPAPTVPAPTVPATQVVCRRTKPSRRGGSSGSPMAPDACPLGYDPRHCDEHARTPWGMDARFYRCTQAGCGKCGRFVERPAPTAATTREAR